MKNIKALTLGLIISFISFSNAYALDIVVENKNLWSPKSGHYVETGLMILGSKLKTKEDGNGKLSVAVDVLLLFKNSKGIVAYDKYRLNKSGIDSSGLRNLALIDKKRFALEEGAYSFQAIVKDANNPSDSTFINELHTVSRDDEAPSFSDIQLIEEYKKSDDQNSDFVKNGIFMTPQVITFYPRTIDKLAFYTELYHSREHLGENENLLITYNVRMQKNSKIANALNGFKKVQSAEVIPFFAEINISKLPSGNYFLRVEARNKENELICRKELNFQRENPSVDRAPEDLVADKSFVEGFDLPSIKYQLSSFMPIANADEARQITTLLKNGELPAMKRYFLQFWLDRDPVDPYYAWYAYTEKVKRVNAEFTTNLLYGFETDRGRVYLQYGPPNQILEAARQAGSNPYEIWHYYNNVGNQNSAKFIFLNRDLIGNNYELIHSTALGEIKNDQWQTLVQSKGFNSPTENQMRSNDYYGNQVDDFYDQ